MIIGYFGVRWENCKYNIFFNILYRNVVCENYSMCVIIDNENFV